MTIDWQRETSIKSHDADLFTCFPPSSLWVFAPSYYEGIMRPREEVRLCLLIPPRVPP